jgi:lysophospholipase L1-like esterase
MHLSTFFPLSFLALASSSTITGRAPKCKPAAFFLAGDSTTATQATSGGGWGDGFLTTLTKGAVGRNYGHNGATTVSFVAGGDWVNVLSSVRNHTKDYEPYVTIQVCQAPRFLQILKSSFLFWGRRGGMRMKRCEEVKRNWADRR